jgi:hypothetical protein
MELKIVCMRLGEVSKVVAPLLHSMGAKPLLAAITVTWGLPSVGSLSGK